MSKTSLIKAFSNIPGWRSPKQIVVIESDDWGSLRMSSLDVFKELTENGLNLSSGDAERYNANETIESAKDLDSLYSTLRLFRDKKNKHPVFTALSLVANPDFEKIRAGNFQQYYYEPFEQTLKRYKRDDAFKLWQQGINDQLFSPQFHGREHLNVSVWMRALQAGDKQTRLAFDKECWSFINNNRLGITYQAAFDLEYESDLEEQGRIISDGLQLFEKLFGFKASFFVPPNGPFNNKLEKVAASQGIKYISASKLQREPLGEGRTKNHFHYLGQKNKHGQMYLTRNCFFEPSAIGKDWVSSCLYDISVAFKWRKPAVISTHRVNYIGELNPKNRDNGLAQLKLLLSGILKNWPDAEFLTSVELGDLITASRN